MKCMYARMYVYNICDPFKPDLDYPALDIN